MRLVSWLLTLLISLQTPSLPGPGPVKSSGGGGGSTATNFVYANNSVTGCFNVLSSQTKCTFAFNSNPGAGHLLLVMAIWQSSSATATFTSTNNTWTTVGTPKVGINTLSGWSGQIFCVASAASGADTGQLTISSSVNFLAWESEEYSYTGTISNCASADGSPSFSYTNTQASGGSASTGTVVTSGSSDLLWAACMGVDGLCNNVGTGYTHRSDNNSCAAASGGLTCSSTTGNDFTSNTGALVAEQVNTAAGSQSTTFSTTGSTDNTIFGIIAE